MAHITVLKNEAVEALTLKSDSVVFDCTLGAGGHAEVILKSLGSSGVYVGFDADNTAIESFKVPKGTKATVHLVNRNFKEIKAVASELKLTPTAIVADLGWRTEQFEAGGKGFSFQKDEPLSMTYGLPENYTFTAYDIVNEWAEESIADVIYGYGEETAARRIARAIVEARKKSPIVSSLTLADIVYKAMPAVRKRSRLHPATKTFQALRIAVNDELGVLLQLLTDGFDLLAPNGRIAIISFHSREDKVVKEFFKTKAHEHQGVLVNKKPIVPSRDEEISNPRSRSAKLRILEKA
jgi:16S rRNA (cytosine1402-N4)-methyltransferase